MSEPWDTGITEYEQAELRADLSAALLCLSEKQRWALLLVCYYGYTQEEAAAMMGITQQSLWERIQNAENAMRGALTL
jgi:DNA-directed RNA polymerase specialized sigma24 family protein